MVGYIGQQRELAMTTCMSALAYARSAWRRRGMSRDPSHEGIAGAVDVKAGVKDEGIMFLFTDGQITNEKFLVFINDLLSSGEVADLYANEDKDAIRNNVRGGCKSAGLQDTPENLWTFFISRIRKNLHMSICFSPVGDGTRAAPLAAPFYTCSSIAITGGTFRWP